MPSFWFSGRGGFALPSVITHPRWSWVAGVAVSQRQVSLCRRRMIRHYGRVSVVSRSDVLSGAWRPFVSGATVWLSAVCSIALLSPYDHHPWIAASRNSTESALVAVSYIMACDC